MTQTENYWGVNHLQELYANRLVLSYRKSKLTANAAIAVTVITK